MLIFQLKLLVLACGGILTQGLKCGYEVCNFLQIVNTVGRGTHGTVFSYTLKMSTLVQILLYELNLRSFKTWPPQNMHNYALRSFIVKF